MYKINPSLFIRTAGELHTKYGKIIASDIGSVHFPTGEVVACDPLILCENPLQRKIPVGTYPIVVNQLYLLNGGERTAYAVLNVSEQQAVTWEMATQKGQDLAILAEDEFFGYGVDTGTGGFMDSQTVKACEEEEQNLDTALDELLDGMYENAYYGFTHSIPNIGDISCFSSGYGDGHYPSFYGLDANGNIVCIVTDFLVHDE